jgi:glyceraldehyde 3-phosphate dehydrogenase
LNVVMGVNDHLYDPSKHRVLTAASCTTNCLAPVVKVIHGGIGIRHGMITTVHDMTNTQSILDTPHKDLRRARASSLSLIPTSTGSATAITQIFPELEGRLNGLAVRVPLLNASLTDAPPPWRRSMACFATPRVGLCAGSSITRSARWSRWTSVMTRILRSLTPCPPW